MRHSLRQPPRPADVPDPHARSTESKQQSCPRGRRPSSRTRFRWALVAGGLVLGVGLVAACGDDPFDLNWIAQPQEVTLFSLDRPELNLPAAFNFVQRQSLRIQTPEAVGRWDLAVDTQGGELVFLPPGALNIPSTARVTVLPDTEFDDVIDAPADSTLYRSSEPVAIDTANVYVFRTHQVSGRFGQVCVYYGKLEPLVVDAATGQVRFLFDVSPVCNSRRLIPPD